MLYITQLIIFFGVFKGLNNLNIGRASNALNLPLKIVGSDEEILHPFYEKEDRLNTEKTNLKFVRTIGEFSSPSKMKSASSSFSGSSNSFKMNLDLPSMNNNLKATAKISGNNIFAMSSSNSNEKRETLHKHLNSPFGKDKDIDLDVVLFTSPNTTTNPTIASSGTVIISSTTNERERQVAPGTIITSFSIATEKDFESKFSVPINNDFSSTYSGSEHRLPLPSKIINNDRNSVLLCPQPHKTNKIKSLEKFEIENLTFDPSYLGPKITIDSSLTADFVYKILIPYFKSEKLLDRKSSYSVRIRTLKIKLKIN